MCTLQKKMLFCRGYFAEVIKIVTSKHDLERI